jgi:hypothetical protein
MKRLTLLVVLLSVVLLTPPAVPQPSKPLFEQRWVWAVYTLRDDKQADDLIALIQRAGKCGYNGVVLSDYGFNFLERMPEGYFKNAARVRHAADAAGVEIIPCVFPIGSSNGLLVHDPNLAEGMEVRDAPFVVDGRVAGLLKDYDTVLNNGGLEQVKGHSFAGFTHQDGPGKTTFADRDEYHDGRISCRVEYGKGHRPGNVRLARAVRVRPNACYRFSAWVKTRDLRPASVYLTVNAADFNRPLTYQATPVQPTQDWTRIGVTFNSLDQVEVLLSAGQQGGQSGIFWLDDLALEELALVNVLRRPGCPLTVTDRTGKVRYEEGKDFLPVRDEKLGVVPYPGEYDFTHPGAKLELTPNTRIRDGQRLLVSWYHPVIIHENQVMCCLAEPKVAELLREQAKRVNDLLQPKTFFMTHDEARVMGWCKACRASHKAPGELLAANASRCVEIVKEVHPGAKVVVWSDMFDPYHNSVRSGNYFVSGSLLNSWLGLPAEVAVVNWNRSRPADSLKWFAEQGHPQILAGHFDGGPESWQRWQEARQGVPGVGGFMYTTWRGDYSQLEAYGKVLRGE